MGAAIRAVLFDASGTLIELVEPVGRTYARVAARYGARLTADAVEAAFRESLREAPPRVFPGVALADVASHERAWWRSIVRRTFDRAGPPGRGFDLAACFDALYRIYAGPTAWRAAPGAREALAALRARGLATGVVSNFDHRLPDLLEALGFTNLLDVVIIPERCGAAKPDPAVFAAALRALGVEPGEAAYVGDDPEKDLAAARAAGLHTLDPTPDALADVPARIDVLATLDARSKPRA